MMTINILAAKTRSAAVIVSSILMFTLVGCGNTAIDPEQPRNSSTTIPTDTESNNGNTSTQGPNSSLGSITVATTTYQVVEAINCVPISHSSLVTRVFDVIATAQSSSGETALFFAYTEEQSGVPGHFIDYQGPEGIWTTPEGNATFNLTDDNLSGAGALVDDANTQTVMVQFNFAVPAEQVDC